MPTLSLRRRRLRLEALEPIVKDISTFLLIHWNTTCKVTGMCVSITKLSTCGLADDEQLLSLLSGDVGTHVP